MGRRPGFADASGLGLSFDRLLATGPPPIHHSSVPDLATPLPGAPVLVVEDDDVLRDVLCQLLQEAGYLVRSASSLEEARRALAIALPAAMLLDLQLGDGSADELLAELVPKKIAPPTVLVSASPRAPGVAQRYSVAFIAKPFDIDGLLALVLRALQSGMERAPALNRGRAPTGA